VDYAIPSSFCSNYSVRECPRLKGHRIGIETILPDYLDGLTLEEIALRYSTLTLEEIYATITYY